MKVQGNDLMSSFTSALNELFNCPRYELPTKWVTWFLKYLNRYASNRLFFEFISEETLLNFTNTVLTKMLAEDAQKKHDRQAALFTRSLNGIMLRILENARSGQMIEVLLELMI